MSKIKQFIRYLQEESAIYNSLVEFAFNQSKAKKKLNELEDQITMHLAKIVAMPNHQSVNHWKTEANAWRLNLIRYNSSKKRSGSNYSKKELIEQLWEGPFGEKKDIDLIVRILAKEGYPIKNIDTAKLKKLCLKYIDSILQKELDFDWEI